MGRAGGDRPPGSQPGSLWDAGRRPSGRDLSAPPGLGEAAVQALGAEERSNGLLSPGSSRRGEFRGAGQLWS